MTGKLTAEQIVQKFSYNMIKKKPFFGRVLMRLRQAQPANVGTAGAANNRIYYDRKYLESKSEGEANFILLHELMHIILRHQAREGERNHILWNVAGDLVINHTLERQIKDFEQVGIPFTLPKDVLLASRGGVDFPKDVADMTTEEVYKVLYDMNQENLPQQQKIFVIGLDNDSTGNSNSDQSGSSSDQKDSGEGDGSGEKQQGDSSQKKPDQASQDGGSEVANTGSQPQGGSSVPQPQIKINGTQGTVENDLVKDGEAQQRGQQVVNEVERIIRAAYSETKDWGLHSGGALIELEILKGTHIPWYRYIRRYLMNRLSDEESFDTPNKNFLWQHKILPGPCEDDDGILEDVIIALDTSGSLFSDSELMNDFFYQTKTLLSDYEMSGRFIMWDVGVQKDVPIDSISDAAELAKDIKGGGGTDLEPVLKYIKKKYRRQYRCVIVFTDGYFSTPKLKLPDTIVVVPQKYAHDTCSANLDQIGKVITF